MKNATRFHNECEDLIYQLLDCIHQLRLVMKTPPTVTDYKRIEKELLHAIGDLICCTGHQAMGLDEQNEVE